MEIKSKCPFCHSNLNVEIDLSHGVPDEAGAECDCGAIPIFEVYWRPQIWLGKFKYSERAPMPHEGHHEG